MIDIRKLKELVKLMVENDLSELDLRDKEETVLIKRGNDGVPMIASPTTVPAAPAIAPPPAGAASQNSAPADGEDAGLQAIESPMVGTFYTAPNPDTPAFVKSGDNVSADSVVCIIEAMKVFNEIKAECSGSIARVLVKNGEAVEFGQKLFLVKPS